MGFSPYVVSGFLFQLNIMDNAKLVTLAVLTYSKAQTLQKILDSQGIKSYIYNVNLIQPEIISGVKICIDETDLAQALRVIENAIWIQEEQRPNVSWKHNCMQSTDRKILVPVDFSNYSLKACECAFRLAEKFHAEIILMHVYFTPIYMPGLAIDSESYNFIMPEDQSSVRTLIEKIHFQFKELSEKILHKVEAGEWPSIKYHCILKEGVVEEEILRYARDQNPMLIVMGNQGLNKKEFTLVGSVSAEVIERSPVLVYVIPENAQLKPLEKLHHLALFTSFDQRDLSAFDSLITTFSAQSFDITFIHISSHNEKWSESNDKLGHMQDYFSKEYPNLHVSCEMIKEDNMLEDIDRLTHERCIDVICIANYKRNIFARLFNSSMATKMLFHSKIPVLILKAIK